MPACLYDRSPGGPRHRLSRRLGWALNWCSLLLLLGRLFWLRSNISSYTIIWFHTITIIYYIILYYTTLHYIQHSYDITSRVRSLGIHDRNRRPRGLGGATRWTRLSPRPASARPRIICVYGCVYLSLSIYIYTHTYAHMYVCTLCLYCSMLYYSMSYHIILYCIEYTTIYVYIGIYIYIYMYIYV